jgi:hypothetical protein
MTRTTTPGPPIFAVRVRPKFREVVLPSGPAPVNRDRPASGRTDVAPPERDDPDRRG